MTGIHPGEAEGRLGARGLPQQRSRPGACLLCRPGAGHLEGPGLAGARTGVPAVGRLRPTDASVLFPASFFVAFLYTFILLIYFLAVLGLCCCTGFSLVAVPRFLTVAFLVAEHRL